MNITDLIRRKRDGGELGDEEIRSLINEFVHRTIPTEQMAAMLMAVWFCGLNTRETLALTQAMADSGQRVNLDAIPGMKVDKHSTGGVGDKTTLILGPLVAAGGLSMAKMSGRSLGHTGGTIDKLESIPGLTTVLSVEQFTRAVQEVGLAIAAQSDHLVPADGKLYSLRNVTATVDSLPLIASSIMSKKMATGADVLLLDVKSGEGALLPDPDDSLQLASLMVDIGCRAGRRTAAAVTDMNQPLGYSVGNALEVAEAIDVLRGEGPTDLRELCLCLGGHLLWLARAASDPTEGRRRAERLITNGAALAKFAEFVEYQGGNPRITEDLSLLPSADDVLEVRSPRDGYVMRVTAKDIGAAAMLLGAAGEEGGRMVDPGAGIRLHKKIGDAVKHNEPLATLHHPHGLNARTRRALSRRVRDAYCVTDAETAPPRLIRALVTEDGIICPAGRSDR